MKSYKKMLMALTITLAICLNGCIHLSPSPMKVTYYDSPSWGEPDCIRHNNRPNEEVCIYEFGKFPSVVIIYSTRFLFKGKAEEYLEFNISYEESFNTDEFVYEDSVTYEDIDVCDTVGTFIKAKSREGGNFFHDTYSTFLIFLHKNTVYWISVDLDETRSDLEFQQSEVDKLISSIECLD